MKILVDENIPGISVAELRRSGHDVRDVRKTRLEGSDDEVLWQLAIDEQRLLISTDRGFSRKREEAHWGILIVALSRPTVASFTTASWRRYELRRKSSGRGYFSSFATQ